MLSCRENSPRHFAVLDATRFNPGQEIRRSGALGDNRVIILHGSGGLSDNNQSKTDEGEEPTVRAMIALLKDFEGEDALWRKVLVMRYRSLLIQPDMSTFITWKQLGKLFVIQDKVLIYIVKKYLKKAYESYKIVDLLKV